MIFQAPDECAPALKKAAGAACYAFWKLYGWFDANWARWTIGNESDWRDSMIYLFARRNYFSVIKGRFGLTCAVAVARLRTGKSIVPWGFLCWLLPRCWMVRKLSVGLVLIFCVGAKCTTQMRDKHLMVFFRAGTAEVTEIRFLRDFDRMNTISEVSEHRVNKKTFETFQQKRRAEECFAPKHFKENEPSCTSNSAYLSKTAQRKSGKDARRTRTVVGKFVDNAEWTQCKRRYSEKEPD